MTIGVKITIALIGAYKRFLRGFFEGGIPLLVVSGCRHWPTCSDYTMEAVRDNGVSRGLWLGVKRILRCNVIMPPEISI